MQKLLTKFAGEDGEVFTRGVNDAPKGGLESGLVHSAKRKVEVFYAEWRSSGNARPDFIGFFMLVDHTFGWDSNIHRVQFSTITEPPEIPTDGSEQTDTPPGPDAGGGPFRPGKDGVGYPSCAYCPAPPYTQDARDAKLEGVVVLQVVIGPDGRASNMQILKKLGHGLDENAIAAVRNWRFKPAPGPNGKPVAVVLPVEVTFRFLR
jgi:TonB family protein